MSITKYAFIFLLSIFTACSNSSRPPTVGQSDQLCAFVEVNVIPMDSERVLKNQTVITRDDQIISIGSSDTVNIPANAKLINGKGKYLMPGLTDMHVHSWGLNFTQFVTYGVTTIRIMRGSLYHLDLREMVTRGEVLGPSIYMSGPFFDGPPPDSADYPITNDPEEAARIVAEQKAAGYDFIKILSQLSPEVYEAIISASRAHSIPVIGHPPLQMDFEKVLSSGLSSIEHLEGYNFALMSDDAPVPDKYDRFTWLNAWKYFDESKLQALVEKTVEMGVWNCPTLVIIVNGRIRPSELEEKLKNPMLRYVNPDVIEYWKEREYVDEEALIARTTDVYRKKIVKALHDAGGKLLLGTDTWQYFTIPGYSLHEELQHFVDAGLSPFEAIKAGTTNAAEFLGAADEFGKVAVGQRADLILLHDNPLEDITNTTHRAGVMLRGKWFSDVEINNMLENIAASYEKKTSK